MIVTAWKNGKEGSSRVCYGFKISEKSRNEIFKKHWDKIFLEIPFKNGNKEIEININKNSFWHSNCRELINKEIGSWLFENEMAPWPKGKPPKVEIIQKIENRFIVKGIIER